MLRKAQVRAYREAGYLLLKGLLSSAEVIRLRAAADELVERSREVSESDATFVVAEGHGATTPRLRRIVSPERHHEAFAELVGHRGILDSVEALIGPDIRFHHGKLNIKLPSSPDAAIEWHQDWAFYPHTNDDILAVGIYLEDCDADSGPLLVIPGSQCGPILDHNDGGRFLGAVDPACAGITDERVVALQGPVGTVTMHHVRTLHGSRPNTGAKPRLLMLNTYTAADAWPILGLNDLAVFDGMMVRGRPTMTPRMERVPVRIPADLGYRGSLFETQKPVHGRSFGTALPLQG